jgi:hypothetical protein
MGRLTAAQRRRAGAPDARAEVLETPPHGACDIRFGVRGWCPRWREQAGLATLAALALSACAGVSAPRQHSHEARCEVSPAAVAVASPDDVLLGRPAPSLLKAFSFEYRWVALEQVTDDTDGNGRLEIASVHHGVPEGDRRNLRLFTRDDTAGREIGGLIAASPSGRRIAVELEGSASVIDTADGREWDIGRLSKLPPWMRPPHVYDRYRTEVRFVDEQRIVFWSREGELDLIDLDNETRTRLTSASGWLQQLWVSRDWALLALLDQPPPPPEEQQRTHAASRGEDTTGTSARHRCDPLLDSFDASLHGGPWLAVRLRSGAVSQVSSGRLWPLPWGLVRLNERSDLSMIVDEKELPIASSCTEALFVAPGRAEPSVTYECNRRGLRRVRPGHPDAQVPTRLLDARSLATAESVAALVPEDATWGIRPRGACLGDFEQGDLVVVVADGDKVLIADEAAKLPARWDRALASNADPTSVRTLMGTTRAWHRSSPSSPWRSLPLPVAHQGCLPPHRLPPEAWGRCVPDDASIVHVDASGWALAFHGWNRSCNAMGPVQPAWTKRFDPHAPFGS